MAASHNSFPTPKDVQQELLWQHQLGTLSFPRQIYERYKALKYYMWNTLMNWNWWWKKTPPVEEQVMLPPGDSHFIATVKFPKHFVINSKSSSEVRSVERLYCMLA